MKILRNIGLAARAVYIKALWPGLLRPVSGRLPVQSLVNWATQANAVLTITYRDVQGVVTTRDIEVISFTKDHVQANCLLREAKFRQFLLSNIIEARWSGRCFTPRDQKARRTRNDLKTPLHASA